MLEWLSGRKDAVHVYYQAALRVCTEADSPKDWAVTQNNLATAYSDLPSGDRNENLRQAIACYQAALRVYNETDFPLDWAVTQNNLALAYSRLLSDECGPNFERAIDHYKAALRIRTEVDFPLQYARTNFNMGNVLSKIGDFENAHIAWTNAARGYNAVGMTDEAAISEQAATSLFDGE